MQAVGSSAERNGTNSSNFRSCSTWLAAIRRAARPKNGSLTGAMRCGTGLTQVLPDILGWVEFWAGGRQVHKTDVGRHLQLARCVPAGLVERDHGVGAARDTAADLIEVKLHGAGVGARKHERGAGVARRADRAEHIGVGVTLVLGLARPRALLGPLIDQAVLLPDPHFILEPDLDRRSWRYCLARGRFRHPRIASAPRRPWRDQDRFPRSASI